MIHPNEKLSYTIEKVSRAPLEDEEGPSNVSANENEDVEKPKARRTPRREVRWLDLGVKKRSLESIKRRFEDRLDRFLSSSSNSLLCRITSLAPMDSKQIHNLHQCPGYLREEITLASDVSKSVIVSHAFPSQSEVCLICGQLVQYNRTEHSIVDGESKDQLSQQRQRDSPSRFPRTEENLNNLSASSGFIDKGQGYCRRRTCHHDTSEAQRCTTYFVLRVIKFCGFSTDSHDSGFIGIATSQE